MRKILATLAAVALVVGTSSLFAAEQTVKGEVIDVQCHVKRGDKGHGADHANCATSCAKKGAPLAILASDGVYEIAGDYAKDNNAKLIEYVAKTVEAKGEVTEKDGKKTIAVTSIKAGM